MINTFSLKYIFENLPFFKKKKGKNKNFPKSCNPVEAALRATLEKQPTSGETLVQITYSLA